MSRVIKGKTDLWTTSLELAKLLLNKEDGYSLSKESHKKSNFVCQNCGMIIYDKIVRNVSKYGLKCPACSDGISYPEKFISNMLKQLNVKFKHDVSLEWSDNKRYDFYIEEYSLIIETHGIQHYDDKNMFNKNDGRIESVNDKYKKDIAIKNNISNYVELDCRYSDFDYIKNSVINSYIGVLFDLSCIDWNCLKLNCTNSIIVDVCNLYNNGTKSIIKIANKLDIDRSTVRKYLSKGASVFMMNTIATHM